MRHHICQVTGVVAVALVIVSAFLLYTAANMTSGPALLGVALSGMYLGVFGAAFGAVAFCTYMTPYERAQYRLQRAQRRSERLKI